MNTAMERLQSVRVNDAMSRGMVNVSASSTMAEAAEVLAEHHVSGVPVINELEQCAGILSTTDFAKREQLHKGNETLATPAGEFMLVRDGGHGPFRIDYVAVGATLEFRLTKTGPAKSLVLHQNGAKQTARRIK